MGQIDINAPTFTIVVALDMPSDRLAPVLELVTTRTEDYIRYLPGFVSASWLTRRPRPGGDAGTSAPDSDAPASARVIEYLQWRTRSHFEAFIHDPAKSAHVATVHELVTGHEFETYQLDAVIAADGGGRLDIVPGDPKTTLVMLIDAQPGKQGWINEYNQSETHRVIRHLDGFFGVGFLLGRRTDRVVEFAQWESQEAFAAAFADERFHEHIPVVGHYAEVDWGFYDVTHTITAPVRTPAAAG